MKEEKKEWMYGDIAIVNSQEFLMGTLPILIMDACNFKVTHPNEKCAILMRMFTMESDRDPSSMIWRLLAEARNIGVQIFVLLDHYGSNGGNVEGNGKKHRFSRSFAKLIQEIGINLAFTRMHIDHSKTAIFIMGEKKIACIGNTNILSGYMEGLSPTISYDDWTAVVEGPITDWVYTSFKEAWKRTKSYPKSKLSALSALPELSKSCNSYRITPTIKNPNLGIVGYVKMRYLHTHGIFGASPIKEIVSLIEKSKREILIRSPYIVVPRKIKKALKRAQNRGVHIEIITGRESDLPRWQKNLLYWISERIGVKIARIPNSFCHHKLILVDRKIMYLGSMNLDLLSMMLLEESGIIVDNEMFCKKVIENI